MKLYWNLDLLNEGLRDWQNMLAIYNEVSIRCIEVQFLHIFNTSTGAKNIVRYTEDSVRYMPEVRCIEVPTVQILFAMFHCTYSLRNMSLTFTSY